MHIWTDGACHPNPGNGGWGWHRSDGEQGFGGERGTTNNRMEMTAILEALRKLPHGQKATIYSDSQYCVKGLTVWHRGWAKRNWMKKGAPMPNRDLWCLLNEECRTKQATFVWVRGHNGNEGNELADRLAEKGRACCLDRNQPIQPIKPESEAVEVFMDTAREDVMVKALEACHMVIYYADKAIPLDDDGLAAAFTYDQMVDAARIAVKLAEDLQKSGQVSPP